MILELENVTKKYKVPDKSKSSLKNILFTKYNEVTAVDNINLSIDKGECIGYIGLNGAGKSTTIKLMTGILTPTSGKINMFGDSITNNKKEKNKHFSVVFGQRSNMWYDLPVRDTYEYVKELYEVSDSEYKENLKNINEILNIQDLIDRPIRKLSLGQKMKCELGAALLYSPELLFLDEPTIGLDIFAKEAFLNCIKNIKERVNTTVVFTSHNMEEIDRICNRIIVLDKGRILFDGTIDKLKSLVGDYQTVRFILDSYDKIKDSDLFAKYYSHDHIENGILELNVNKNEVPLAEVMNYYFSNCVVKDVTIENSNLEKLLKRLYLKKECVL